MHFVLLPASSSWHISPLSAHQFVNVSVWPSDVNMLACFSLEFMFPGNSCTIRQVLKTWSSKTLWNLKLYLESVTILVQYARLLHKYNKISPPHSTVSVEWDDTQVHWIKVIRLSRFITMKSAWPIPNINTVPYID